MRGLVRYMDDLVWWGDERVSVRAALDQARVFTKERLFLDIKAPVQMGRSSDGLSLCGFRAGANVAMPGVDSNGKMPTWRA